MMPFASGEAMPERAKRDGCDCREWVLRCCHFGDRRVTLATQNGFAKMAGCNCFSDAAPRFTVTTTEGPGVHCPDNVHCTAKAWLLSKSVMHHSSNDEATALVAFYAAEEELLRGAS